MIAPRAYQRDRSRSLDRQPCNRHSHPDHQYGAVAVVEAVVRWGGTPTFFYTNHADENRYPYGPAGTVMSLPAIDGALSVQGIYSHATDPALQTRKLFALESMHDLRPSPDEQSACQVPNWLLRGDYPRNQASDYFRRGPRANELFYVYDTAGLQSLVRGFLAR